MVSNSTTGTRWMQGSACFAIITNRAKKRKHFHAPAQIFAKKRGSGGNNVVRTCAQLALPSAPRAGHMEKIKKDFYIFDVLRAVFSFFLQILYIPCVY